MPSRCLSVAMMCVLTIGCMRDTERAIDLGTPGWSVDGVLMDANKRPIPGAYLELRYAGHRGERDLFLARISTGPDGRFYFATPINGVFTIDVVGLSPLHEVGRPRSNGGSGT